MIVLALFFVGLAVYCLRVQSWTALLFAVFAGAVCVQIVSGTWPVF